MESIGKKLGQLNYVTNFKRVSALVAVALMVVIVVGVMGSYVLYTFYIAPGPPPPSGEEVFYGTISITIGEENSLDRGADVATDSDSYVAYHPQNKSFDEAEESDFVGGSTFTVGTAKDYGVESGDNGEIWFKAYSGTDYFLDIDETIAGHSRIKEHRFIDVDNDNKLETVFLIDVSDISEPLPVSKPTLDLTIMVIREDTTLALNSPADQDSIGTGTKTGTIEWQLTGIAEKYGACLARVYVTQNRTQEDFMSVTNIEIDQVGIYSGGDITYESGAKAWYFDIDIDDYREVVECPQLTRPSGGKSYVGITISWETYFTAASDAVNVTLYLEPIGADEAVDTTLSDAVALGG